MVFDYDYLYANNICILNDDKAAYADIKINCEWERSDDSWLSFILGKSSSIVCFSSDQDPSVKHQTTDNPCRSSSSFFFLLLLLSFHSTH